MAEDVKRSKHNEPAYIKIEVKHLMHDLIHQKPVNLILLITILGEFILPWSLERFYPGYDSKTMVMSVLGSPDSPVSTIYNLWLVWLGACLCVMAYLLYVQMSTVSNMLAILTFLSVAVFAVGAGILAGLFPVNESKEKVTVASSIHGIGSAIGFMALLFFPLFGCIAAVIVSDWIQAAACGVAFVLAMLFFVFFILGDKPQSQNTFLSFEGLWERLCLFFMYVPFLYHAITHLFTA